MLKVKNLTYKIGNKILLNDVSVDFYPGKINLIIGPNGAGKSTLIKVISNQIHPETGSVHFADKTITSYSISEVAKIRSVLSQNIELAFPLKVSEIVMMGRYPHFMETPGQKDESACEDAMRFFNIWDMAARDYTTLSGGEKQRVHFARVFAQIWYPVSGGCRYLILDEPLTFLDIHYQFDFMHKIKEFIQNKDVVVVVGVVHDLNLAAKFADHITLINEAKIIASGLKNEVLTKENIKAVYQLEPVIHYFNNSMYLFFE